MSQLKARSALRVLGAGAIRFHEKADNLIRAKLTPRDVTVISMATGTHVEEDFFRDASESLRRQNCLAEWIVVTGHADQDEVQRHVEKLPDDIRAITSIVVSKDLNNVPAHGRELGVHEARTDKVAFLDIDDMYRDDGLDQARAMMTSGNHDAVLLAVARFETGKPSTYILERNNWLGVTVTASVVRQINPEKESVLGPDTFPLAAAPLIARKDALRFLREMKISDSEAPNGIKTTRNGDDIYTTLSIATQKKPPQPWAHRLRHRSTVSRTVLIQPADQLPCYLYRANPNSVTGTSTGTDIERGRRAAMEEVQKEQRQQDKMASVSGTHKASSQFTQLFEAVRTFAFATRGYDRSTHTVRRRSNPK